MICLSVNGGRAGHARACGPSHLRLEAMSFTVCAPASLRCRSCESVMFRTRVAAVRRCRPPKLSILSVRYCVFILICADTLLFCMFLCLLLNADTSRAPYISGLVLRAPFHFLFLIIFISNLFAVCRLPFAVCLFWTVPSFFVPVCESVSLRFCCDPSMFREVKFFVQYRIVCRVV